MPRITIKGAINPGHAYSQTTVTEVTSRRDASGRVENTFRQIQHNSGATPQHYQPAAANAQDWAEFASAYEEPPPLAYSRQRAATRAIERAPPVQGLLEYYPDRDQTRYTGGSRRPSQGQLGRSRSVREPRYNYVPNNQNPPAAGIARRGSVREFRREHYPEPAQPSPGMSRRDSVRESRRVYPPQQAQPVQFISRGEFPDDERRTRSRRPSQGQRDHNDPEYEDPSRSRVRSRAPSVEPPRQLYLVRRSSRRGEKQ